MAKETPDPETTLACWAWLLRALHHAREARDDAREALEALDLTAIQIAGLRERIAAIDESERACLEAAAKGDPWRVWDRYTNSPRAEAAFGGFARDLCRSPSVAHLAPGRGADNSHRHRVIGEIHRGRVSTADAVTIFRQQSRALPRRRENSCSVGLVSFRDGVIIYS